MHRFFLPHDAVRQGNVVFPAPFAHQLKQVLRLVPGDRVQVADNSGWIYEVELGTVSAQDAQGYVRSKTLGESEPRTKITIYQALLKADKFEHVLQKCTELGASAFVPMVCDRSVVANVRSLDGPQFQGKLVRWRAIIREAAELSRRAKLPQLREPMLFEQACESARGLSLLLSEKEHGLSLRGALRDAVVSTTPPALEPSSDFEDSDRMPMRKLPQRGALPRRPFSVSLFLGPEGGFSDREVITGSRMGLIPVGLGPRILRAETATVAATSIVLYEWGDMG